MTNHTCLKAHIFKGLCIALGLVVVNLACYILLITLSPTFQKVREIYYFRDQSNDIMVMGNSAGLDGFDASIISKHGNSTYNFCVGGTHIKSSVLILEEYLKKNKKPKKIILCLTSSMETTFLKKFSFVDPCINYFYNKNNLEKISTIYFKEFEWLFVEMVKIIFSKPHRDAKLVLGQWQILKIVPDDSKYSGKAILKPNYQSNYLDYFLKIARSNNIDVLAIEMPGWRKYRNDLPPQYEITTRSNLVVEIKNFNNFSVADSLFNPQTDWLSLNHLNQNGAEKFTLGLFPIIMGKGSN